MKFYRSALLILWVCFSKQGQATLLDSYGLQTAQTLLKNESPSPDFHSLTPDLLESISKSFYLLHECLPEFLENSCYIEFGLYRGFSLWFAQKFGQTMAGKNFHYYGFDSFAGLPDASQDYIHGMWWSGLYAASLEEVTGYLQAHGADFSTLHLVKGWYGDSLFSIWKPTLSKTPPAFVTIDCDTYESTKETLKFLPSLARPGMIIIFDDFNTIGDDYLNGFSERKAFIEFLEENRDCKFIPLFSHGTHGYAFMVVACQGFILDPHIQEKVQEILGPPDRLDSFPFCEH